MLWKLKNIKKEKKLFWFIGEKKIRSNKCIHKCITVKQKKNSRKRFGSKTLKNNIDQRSNDFFLLINWTFKKSSLTRSYNFFVDLKKLFLLKKYPSSDKVSQRQLFLYLYRKPQGLNLDVLTISSFVSFMMKA